MQHESNLDETRRRLDERFAPWRSRTLWQLLDEAADEVPERPLVVTDDRVYSYRAVRDWSQRLGAGLSSLGVRPGEHVAVVMANYPEFVAVKFAIASIGAVAVPINFLLRATELAYVLEQSDAVALITMDRYRDLDYVATLDTIMPGWRSDGGSDAFPRLRHVAVFPTSGAHPGGLQLEDLDVAATEDRIEGLRRRAAPGDPSNVSDILYTSGTTGSPKGVLITHDMVTRTAYGAAWSRALRDAHRMVFALPMYHVFGYVECLVAALWVRGTVVPRVEFSASDILQAIETHGCHELVAVPTMTLAILDEVQEEQYELSSLHTVFSSGGKPPDDLWDRIKELLKPNWIVTGYGQTETTAATAMTRPEDDEYRLRTTLGVLRQTGAAGDPTLQGRLAVYKVLDPITRQELPAGQPGELMVRGPIVTPGYYNKPHETEEAFDADGWMHTGDIGTLSDEGYITMVGRIKETYRCGGETVMPAEVEAVLVSHPGVKEAHVVGIPDERMGEVGCACLIIADGDTVEDVEVIERCAEQLARFKVPRHVLIIEPEDLPLTVTGRVQKFKLAEWAQRQLEAAPSSA